MRLLILTLLFGTLPAFAQTITLGQQEATIGDKVELVGLIGVHAVPNFTGILQEITDKGVRVSGTLIETKEFSPGKSKLLERQPKPHGMSEAIFDAVETLILEAKVSRENPANYNYVRSLLEPGTIVYWFELPRIQYLIKTAVEWVSDPSEIVQMLTSKILVQYPDKQEQLSEVPEFRYDSDDLRSPGYGDLMDPGARDTCFGPYVN